MSITTLYLSINSNRFKIYDDDYKRGLSRHYSENRNQPPAAIELFHFIS